MKSYIESAIRVCRRRNCQVDSSFWNALVAGFGFRLARIVGCVCTVFLMNQAVAQNQVDQRLIGEWIETGEDFEGEKATITQNSIVLYGERLPLRFGGPGVMYFGDPDEQERIQYRLSGDILTVLSEGEVSTWKRVGGSRSGSEPDGAGSGLIVSDRSSGQTDSHRFARRFDGKGISMTLTKSQAPSYEGELRFNGTRYPVTARAEGDQLTGSFRNVDGRSFDFSATLSGDILTMKTGSTTYAMTGEPLVQPGNPLDIDGASSRSGESDIAPNPLDPKTAPSSSSVFREHKLTDPEMNNIVASTVLIPEGWEAEGGLKRMPPSLYSMPVFVDVKFTAPDGRQAHFFPSLTFDFDHSQPGQILQPTLNGNLYMPLPQSPGTWLMEMARMSPDPEISNLKLVSEKEVPEVTEMLRRQSQQLIQQVSDNNRIGAQTGLTQSYDTQGTMVVLTYDRGGRSYEESVLIMWNYMVSAWQGQVTSGLWSIPSMFSLRGPAGTDYLNDPELIAILGSVRINPAWQNEMNKYWTQLAQIRHKGSMDRMQASAAAHQKRMQTMNETSDILMNGWKSRNASQDRMHTRTVDAIHEQTPYATPSGETVKLPSFYSNVYTDGNGRYILNNDAFYEPNTDPTVNSRDWQRIQPQE